MADDAASRDWDAASPSLMGDVGEEIAKRTSASAQASAACRSRICVANPRNPRRISPTPNSTSSPLDQGARHHPADRGARGAAPPTIRDHRRRAALARGAARRPARRADRRRRGHRRAGAGTRHHRERAARRSQSDRRGGRLSGADRRVRSQPGRRRADRRQEPQPRRQHAAAAEAVRAGEGAGAVRASFRPATRACWSASRTPKSLREEIVERGLNVRQVEAMARKSGREQARDMRKGDVQPARTPTPRAGETTVRRARACSHDRSSRRRRRHAADPLPHLDQLDDVIARLERGPKIAKDEKSEDGRANGPRIRRT